MNNKSKKKYQLGYTLCVAGVLALGANTVSAGEVDGKGNPVPGGVKGKSECSYSGQQDDPTLDPFFKGDRVQSYGQLPKWLRDIIKAAGGHPGVACNPKKAEG